ncbi:interferon-induced GTP-binding protein Mx [Nemania sp. NC0429]|nr:interferon-induced GTP-binding protein Mx [Nemania sp. NC0429]
MANNTPLEELQTDEQRRILDTVTQIRKCGLESVLSLPQIVVCGDQSAGKSSVLEALTEIPFPRNDNLCTRFATEISLRREPVDRLTVKVIPDNTRPSKEQDAIKGFSETITDFKDLPVIMEAAKKVMGISNAEQTPGKAFARDVLSIEIEGPNRPQVTLVDIPGLIQASTKGVSDADVHVVAGITDHYISQSRTICLAVIAATNDAANQPILQKVRKFDPKGERTLGVITKLDRLPVGSGSEANFLELAKNEDVFFKLGWHVVKNRKFEEREFSIQERNSSEMEFFQGSVFNTLPRENVGIDTLRLRLSHLLFEHIKVELPHLNDELETTLAANKKELALLGTSRSTAEECRTYLAQLSMNCHNICKAALQGNYEGSYFKCDTDKPFSLDSRECFSRLRAALQYANAKFEEALRTRGHKYAISMSAGEGNDDDDNDDDDDDGNDGDEAAKLHVPSFLSKTNAMEWVQKMLLRSRGNELLGSFNPNLIAELFWEQSEPWEKLASDHVEVVCALCLRFLDDVLTHMAPQDVKSRLWSAMIVDDLNKRREAAFGELRKLVQDNKDFPINYNHYYTDNVQKRRQERLKGRLQKRLTRRVADTGPKRCSMGDHYRSEDVYVTIDTVISSLHLKTTEDMDKFSCEEALDSLLSIYKVQQKTFLANVTAQVIERHVVRGLDEILSPLKVFSLAQDKIEAIVSEPSATARQRLFLADRVKKLEEGREIFRGVMGFHRRG